MGSYGFDNGFFGFVFLDVFVVGNELSGFVWDSRVCLEKWGEDAGAQYGWARGRRDVEGRGMRVLPEGRIAHGMRVLRGKKR